MGRVSLNGSVSFDGNSLYSLNIYYEKQILRS